MSDFATLLKQYRAVSGLSQSKLSLKADLDHSYISRLESDARRPTRNAVNSISKALNLSQEHHEALIHAAGFVDPNDAQALADLDVRDLATLFIDQTIPESYRDMVRSNVRGLIESAKLIRREWRAA